ncbi:MAG: HemK2/MTQ2 family protein methyltransferase [Candidatus Thorarchaeota archaeon]
MSTFPDPIINCNYKNVYAPSDDTYLMLDYFKSHINSQYFDGIKLSEVKNLLDMGTGTGLFAIFFQIIKNKYHNFNPKIYASDILDEAIKCAESNQIANGINHKIIFLNSNLFNSFPSQLRSSFNIIIFNPPYLPSSQLIKREEKKIIDYSWDGGIKGYDIIINFLNNAPSYLNLKKEHYIYCITSSRTNLKKLNREIIKLGYENEIVSKKRIFFEQLNLNKLKYT